MLPLVEQQLQRIEKVTQRKPSSTQKQARTLVTFGFGVSNIHSKLVVS